MLFKCRFKRRAFSVVANLYPKSRTVNEKLFLWYLFHSHSWKGKKLLCLSLLKNKQQRIRTSGLFFTGKEADGDIL